MTTTKEPLGKILVVDDEIELKNALVEVLLNQSYDARGYANGYEALEALRREDFDLMITDLMMPEMDGITLIKAALEIDPYLVPIMMTGSGSNDTAAEAKKAGAFDYLLKPFRLKTLMPLLERAMNSRLSERGRSQEPETAEIQTGLKDLTIDPLERKTRGAEAERPTATVFSLTARGSKT